jgi:hypothetical protein
MLSLDLNLRKLSSSWPQTRRPAAGPAPVVLRKGKWWRRSSKDQRAAGVLLETRHRSTLWRHACMCGPSKPKHAIYKFIVLKIICANHHMYDSRSSMRKRDEAGWRRRLTNHASCWSCSHSLVGLCESNVTGFDPLICKLRYTTYVEV